MNTLNYPTYTKYKKKSGTRPAYTVFDPFICQNRAYIMYVYYRHWRPSDGSFPLSILSTIGSSTKGDNVSQIFKPTLGLKMQMLLILTYLIPAE